MDSPISEALNIQRFMIVWDIHLKLKSETDTLDLYTPLSSLNPNNSENLQWIRLLSNFSWIGFTTYMINLQTYSVLDIFQGMGKFSWNHCEWSENMRFVFEVEMQYDTPAVQPTIWKRCITEAQTAIKANEIFFFNLGIKTATETVVNNRGLSFVVKRFTENKTHKLYIEPEIPSKQWNLLSVMLKKKRKQSF